MNDTVNAHTVITHTLHTFILHIYCQRFETLYLKSLLESNKHLIFERIILILHNCAHRHSDFSTNYATNIS